MKKYECKIVTELKTFTLNVEAVDEDYAKYLAGSLFRQNPEIFARLNLFELHNLEELIKCEESQ